MTDHQHALQAADAVLALINAQPRTPTREQLAAAIAAHLPAAGAAEPRKIELPPEGEAFAQAAEWELALMRASVALPASGGHRLIGEYAEAGHRVEQAARRVWGRPAGTLGDVAGCALVAAHLRWEAFDDKRWQGSDGRLRCKFFNGHVSVGNGVDELIAAVERVSGIRRVATGPDRVAGAVHDCELVGFAAEARA